MIIADAADVVNVCFYVHSLIQGAAKIPCSWICADCHFTNLDTGDRWAALWAEWLKHQQLCLVIILLQFIVDQPPTDVDYTPSRGLSGFVYRCWLHTFPWSLCLCLHMLTTHLPVVSLSLFTDVDYTPSRGLSVFVYGCWLFWFETHIVLILIRIFLSLLSTLYGYLYGKFTAPNRQQ